jgi:hypothetical protein
MDPAATSPRSADEIAIERYRYLLRTAPPDDIERAHAEAFARLTPEQRQQVLSGLAGTGQPGELQDADASPDRLARLATRTEVQYPGTLERLFGSRGGGWGSPGLGGTFFSTLAGAFVGTAIAGALFGDYGYPPGDPAATDAGAGEADAGGADPSTADSTADGGTWGGDTGSWDSGDAGGIDVGDGGFDIGDMGGF